MKSLEIIVETADGVVIQVNCGATFIMDDGREITYEQMFKWLSEGSLKQHGFYPYKGHTSKSHRSSSNYAACNAANLATIAAVTAATI